MVGALALTLAACGSDNAVPGAAGGESSAPAAGGSELSGELVGAGASSQESAMEAWRAGFQSANPDVSVSYDPAGSGAGRTQFLEGGTDFAGSDAALDEEELATAEERCFGAGVTELPLYISPIAVIYNLPEVTEQLQMSAATIAGIFSGAITNWNDPAIAAENEGVTLPDLAITPVNRSDESGTTENFTEYLAAAAPEVWTEEPSGDWPFSGTQSAQGTSGVVQTVEGAEGTIGYADASRAGSLGTVAVKVGEEYVPFSPEAAAAVVDASPVAEGRAEHDLALELERDTTEAGAYPIVLVSYTIACLAYEEQEQVDLVKAWLTYLASEGGQQAAAGAAGNAPISETLREQVTAAIGAITLAS
ncbi:phosphate ABC transporter substrate-binding protein PstS [Cellulomonas marina]|uniref:phosphate ABC transporter substrate-binding protein PstS n=1 Tax=Cellulomonas marina TaxID=988821 RepID=UPI001A53D5F6|nr:phosphate ABC transporter substrate-binding protein PstS [Cellulomonas marina]GIG27729.1 phosphate-binding protein PstS [Cellulomonas marina]